MAAFETFDLGRALGTAEQIKSMRRQSAFDTLREQAARAQMEHGAQASKIATAQEARTVTQFNQEQQIAGTKLLNAAAAEISQDPSDEVLQRWLPQLEQAGVKFGANPLAVPPEVRQQFAAKLFKSTSAALSAIDPQKPAAPEDVVAVVGPDGRPKYVKKSEAPGQKPYEKPDSGGEAVNNQLITRPIGNGMVQDFAWNPRTKQREPNGEPYKPVTPHTGNVTEGERKAAALGTRLESAMNVLNDIETRAPGASRPGLLEKGLEAVGGETAANTVRGSERQQADSAQLDALDAALTLATGAAYTREQLQNLRKSYFPQIGDSDANVAAKRKRFETIVETARIASGRAEPAIDRALSNDTTQPAGRSSTALSAQPDFVWVPGKGLQQAP